MFIIADYSLSFYGLQKILFDSDQFHYVESKTKIEQEWQVNLIIEKRKSCWILMEQMSKMNEKNEQILQDLIEF